MPEITSRLSTALADRYQIERHLGEGGMATVYLAEDLKHERKVAVKVLRPELAGEGHGFHGLANRHDLTTRYFEFFDHYLKGAPAPTWMTDGVPFLVKE